MDVLTGKLAVDLNFLDETYQLINFGYLNP